MTVSASDADWKSTACILCECNCGIEVQLGGADGRRLVRVRGDDAHPISQGYACEKPSRLDFYQNGPHRLTKPLRRRDDGTFEEIDWDTAIREVAARFAAVRDAHGGESIFYYGGGGQGNHLPGAYGRATRAVIAAAGIRPAPGNSRLRAQALRNRITPERS
jgi:anaerobic selenocysteine-containing dehydrogenase